MTFSDIAVLATSIHKDYFNLSKEQKNALPIISSDKDKKTFYAYILKCAQERKIHKIDLYKIDYRQKHILGRFQMYADEACVMVSNEMNNCWTRYVVAKELSHLIVDKARESMTTDINKTITWMLSQGMSPNIHAALDSEHIAAQFAAEILIPYAVSREMLHSDQTSYEIASCFGVPERMIDTLRDPEYAALRDKAYSDI